MNTGKVNIITALALVLALSACGTTSGDRLASNGDRPILSAAQVESMIHVEVTVLEPLLVDENTVALAK
jgi:hypothetical protein